MARSRQDSAKAQELAASLNPGTIVIARVKGYPAWPAVVVDEKDVPASVRKAKPSKKVVVPVLFYNDNSFLWISPEEAEHLSKEQATKNSNAKIKRTLKDAYAMAANPPALSKLIAVATGKADVSELYENKADTEESEEAAAEPEPVAPTPRSRRARSAAERAQEQLPARAKVKAGGRKHARTESPAATQTPPPASKKAKKTEVSDGEEDSEYVDNGTEETEESAATETEGVGSEDLAQSQAARFKLCLSIRQVIQEVLLLSDGKINNSKVSKVEDSLQRLEQAPDIELSVLRRSKLVRVVYDVLQSSSNLPEQLKAKLESYYEQWNTKAEPIIRGIPEELAPKEETEEPEDYNTSIGPSRETTEAPQTASPEASKPILDSLNDVKDEKAATEEAKTEEAKAEETKAEESKTEDSKPEESKTEEAEAEDPKTEEPKTEDSTNKSGTTTAPQTEGTSTEDATKDNNA